MFCHRSNTLAELLVLGLAIIHRYIIRLIYNGIYLYESNLCECQSKEYVSSISLKSIKQKHLPKCTNFCDTYIVSLSAYVGECCVCACVRVPAHARVRYMTALTTVSFQNAKIT